METLLQIFLICFILLSFMGFEFEMIINKTKIEFEFCGIFYMFFTNIQVFTYKKTKLEEKEKNISEDLEN